MPTAKVTLHTHDNKVSYDSFVPLRSRAILYRQLGFDAIAPLGHDEFSNFNTDGLITFRAIEKTVSSSDPEIHIVEIPEIEFKFLAHPRRMGVENVKQNAREIIDNRNLDGVEKYNEGTRQYDGTIDEVTELANDDAHNFFQTGTSYMMFNVEEITADQIISSLKREDFKLVNKHNRIIGDISKMFTSAIGSLFTDNIP